MKENTATKPGSGLNGMSERLNGAPLGSLLPFVCTQLWCKATALVRTTTQDMGGAMLWIVFSVLMVLWIVGLTKEPMGGFIHVLLILAAIAAGTELALAWRRKRMGN